MRPLVQLKAHREGETYFDPIFPSYVTLSINYSSTSGGPRFRGFALTLVGFKKHGKVIDPDTFLRVDSDFYYARQYSIVLRRYFGGVVKKAFSFYRTGKIASIKRNA
jgi:hypothetical protein